MVSLGFFVVTSTLIMAVTNCFAWDVPCNETGTVVKLSETDVYFSDLDYFWPGDLKAEGDTEADCEKNYLDQYDRLHQHLNARFVEEEIPKIKKMAKAECEGRADPILAMWLESGPVEAFDNTSKQGSYCRSPLPGVGKACPIDPQIVSTNRIFNPRTDRTPGYLLPCRMDGINECTEQEVMIEPHFRGFEFKELVRPDGRVYYSCSPNLLHKGKEHRVIVSSSGRFCFIAYPRCLMPR